jgi:hypothetical protein
MVLVSHVSCTISTRKTKTKQSGFLHIDRDFFESEGVELTARGREQHGNHLRNWNAQENAAWVERDPQTRSQIILFDLIESENSIAREIASAVYEGRDSDARSISKAKHNPMKTISDIFTVCNLPITISAGERGTIVAWKDDGSNYGVNRLSDGERNALLITAAVLTQKAGTLILIDEPERHLHRSIVSPLLSQLFQIRADCGFIVSTHDVSLVTDNPSARALLLRRCLFANDRPIAWESDLVEGTGEIDDAFKSDVLGARRCTLFVEGKARSLDNRLYGLIFESTTVVPKETCREVMHAVKSIDSTQELHWVQAFGIIDNDNRGEGEKDQLREQNIFALPAYSIESLYYSPYIQRLVAHRKATFEGTDAEADLEQALEKALQSVNNSADYLCRRRVESMIRHQVLEELPGHSRLASMNEFKMKIDVASRLEEEKQRLEGFLDQRDIDGILARYPIKQTGVLTEIARALRFAGRNDYETAVVTALADNGEALSEVRGIFRPLTDKMQPTF